MEGPRSPGSNWLCFGQYREPPVLMVGSVRDQKHTQRGPKFETSEMLRGPNDDAFDRWAREVGDRATPKSRRALRWHASGTGCRLPVIDLTNTTGFILALA